MEGNEWNGLARGEKDGGLRFELGQGKGEWGRRSALMGLRGTPTVPYWCGGGFLALLAADKPWSLQLDGHRRAL